MLNLCQEIAFKIKQELIKNISYKETLLDTSNLKSNHHVDELAINIIKKYESPLHTFHIEGIDYDDKFVDNKRAFYIDPIDGSLNWDRNVGDPCIVIASSPMSIINTLNDLDFAYVLGLRSNDEYWCLNNSSYYKSGLTNQTIKISTSNTTKVNEATLYLRPGYSLAKPLMEYSLNHFLNARDIRAFDNTGIEICEIARGAADGIIEARNASDGFNLLAWPILKAAGGVLTDLNGNDLSNKYIQLNEIINYIASVNHELLDDILKLHKQTNNDFNKLLSQL